MSKYSLDHIGPVGSYYYTSGEALCLPRLLQQVLSSKSEFLRPVSMAGSLIGTLPQVLDYIKKYGGRILSERLYDNDNGGNFVFLWDNSSYLEVSLNKKANSFSVTGNGLSDTFLTFSKELERRFVSKIKKKLVFTIVQTSSGFSIKSMGDGYSPLIRENYNEEVLQDLDYVIASFKKVPPNGRICIINGEPGTGKTHLIRSVLGELDCVFLIVPANLVAELDKPAFINTIVDLKDYEKPVVLIVEDGDICLVPRKSDNISIISSILNLSDGIVGSIVDIRMVISTNAAIKDMDEAILRPGRLCRQIYVGPLPYERANELFHKLKKDTSSNLDKRKLYTLAEIYHAVNSESIPEPNSHHFVRKVIGFSSQSEGDRILNKVSIDKE